MLTEREILTVVGQELASAQGYSTYGNDSIEGNRQAALSYYLGNPNGKEQAGRSSVTSTDVADAIEWIMPQIMKALTSNNEVVIFDPSGADDEAQADLESSYVYDILMKDNQGFIVLHQLIKDALMQKNGIVKAFYENKKIVEKENYTGITPEQFQVLMMQDGVELISRTEYETEYGLLFDVRISRNSSAGEIKVVSVPPENFCISANHNSIDISTAAFCAHIETKTVSQLIEEGYDRAEIEAIPQEDEASQASAYRFYMQNETFQPQDLAFDYTVSQRELTVAECYMYLDIDDDGIGEYVKITVAGASNPSAVLSIEEIELCPFVSATAILMSHKFFGLSIYDRLKQIQDHKTSLWRNTMDNIYLQNNQRVAVLEGQVNLDDLLLSRPGGVVRMKRLDAVQPMITPQIGDNAYKMLEYLDMTRAGRVGVDANGEVQLDNVGDRIGSQGVDRVMNAKEELVNLMIRVVAETGIKPLCYLIRDLATRHIDSVSQYRFKESWHSVNPATWNRRLRSTVRVGLGTGDKRMVIEGAQAIISMQEKILMNPSQGMVGPDQVYNAINFAAKQMGIDGIGRFFMSPQSPEGQQAMSDAAAGQDEQKQAEKQIAFMAAQAQIKLAEAENQKAAAIHQKNQLQAQIDTQSNQIKVLEADKKREVEFWKEKASTAQKDAELEFKYHQNDTKVAVELTAIEVQAKTQLDKQFQENEELAEDIGSGDSDD